MKIIEDYIITQKLNLNLEQLKNSCFALHDIIKREFQPEESSQLPYFDNTSKLQFTTSLYESYNLLMYTFPQFHELYEEIRNLFRSVCTYEERYYIQCWVNFYKKGDFIDWHHHWPPQDNAWHGFFCVDCEPSKTTYRIPNVEYEVDVPSENNLLVLSRSGGDMHRTWPWEDENRDRITIAFDIVPKGIINYKRWVNHWIPI